MLRSRTRILQYLVFSGLIGIFAVAWLGVPTAPARPQPLRGVAPAQNAAIVVPAAWETDAAVSLAANDLRAALAATFGMAARVVPSDAPDLQPFNFLLLSPGAPLLAKLVEDGALSAQDLSEDGYRILRFNYRGVPQTAIVGGGIRGMAYGAFKLIESYQLDPESISRPMDIKAEPAVKFRFVSNPTGDSYPSPDQALRWGYNAVAITQWPWLVTYDGVNPAIYGPVDSTDRAWMQANRAEARKQIEQAKAYHLQVVTSGDVVSFPKPVWDLYRDELAVSGDEPTFCLDRPRVQQLFTYALKEVMASFPEIDAIMIRTGENYPAGPVLGNPPSRKACGGDGADMIKMERLTIDLSYRQIVQQGGKLYIQRAWDIGNDGFHADPDVADAILKDYVNVPGMIVSFKHTTTDYWRHNPVNPNLSRPGISKMVEYQAAREYEGKAAFPNYIGGLVANGAPETPGDGTLSSIVAGGVSSAWVWAKGGGWNGPILKSELWLDVNNYALSHLIWDPTVSPRVLATQWAVLKFGPQAAPHVVRALELSEEMVLRTFYVAPFARQQGAWAPNILWTRDDLIYGGDRVGAIYLGSKQPNDYAEALAEKDQGRRLAHEISAELTQASQLSTDPALATEALNGAFYGEALADTMTHYVSGLFRYFHWLDSGKTDEVDRKSGIEHLMAWQSSWRHYNNAILGLPGVATGYLDSGMVNAANTALEDLNRGR